MQSTHNKRADKRGWVEGIKKECVRCVRALGGSEIRIRISHPQALVNCGTAHDLASLWLARGRADRDKRVVNGSNRLL